MESAERVSTVSGEQTWALSSLQELCSKLNLF